MSAMVANRLPNVKNRQKVWWTYPSSRSDPLDLSEIAFQEALNLKGRVGGANNAHQ